MENHQRDHQCKRSQYLQQEKIEVYASKPWFFFPLTLHKIII